MTIVLCVLSIAFAQPPKPWHEATPIAWGPLTQGWQLALFAEKQSMFSDEPVRVMLVARNGNPVRLRTTYRKSPWDVADFTIRRVADGKVLSPRPPRDPWERLRRGAGGVSFFYAEPGQIVRPGLVDLRDMFDLGPGTYTIQATCKLPHPGKKEEIKVPSNQITISVIAR